MSTEMEKLSKDDILETFLVTDRYGENGRNWPRETVAACKIICTDKDGQKRVFHQVYRNEPNKHAEVKLIEYLTSHPLGQTSPKMIIKVYINYSPCSSCATAILKYIERIEKEEGEVEMTITFANFYKTHVYPGIQNLQKDAISANIAGLRDLHNKSGVELRLFGVHVGWERFLGMSEFCNLTEDEKNECLDKAESPRRKDRERQDQKVWDEIFAGVEDITSGLQNISI